MINFLALQEEISKFKSLIVKAESIINVNNVEEMVELVQVIQKFVKEFESGNLLGAINDIAQELAKIESKQS